MDKEIGVPQTCFAVNRYPPELYDCVIQTLDAALAVTPELQTYALIDSAFDDKFFARCKRNGMVEEPIMLYAGTELAQLTDVSPCLIPLPSEAAVRNKQLGTLLRLADGKPMLSLLTSPLDVGALKNIFMPLLQAETEDGQQFVVRFADTRILPGLIAIVDRASHASLSAAIGHWWAIDRIGQLACLLSRSPQDLQNSPSIPDTGSPMLPLSNQQLVTLLDLAEADAIIEQLRLITPEQCASLDGGSLHQFIDAQLRHADSFGVEGTLDRIAYCIGAFNAAGRLHQLPAAQSLLAKKAWPPGDLAGALADLPEECWLQ